MTYSDISLLVDYNYWARDRLLEAVAALTPEEFTRPLGNSFSSIARRGEIGHAISRLVPQRPLAAPSSQPN